jgi:hypothetical protein
VTSVARLTATLEPYRDSETIAELTGRCVIIEGNGANVMHGTYQRTTDPITIEPADHECYGVQTTTLSMRFVEIKRLMLCPCTETAP